jgi:putative hemolysin
VNGLVGEILLVLLFILIGGTFNASEIALISLRHSQVERLAATRGARGRRLAKLVSDPNRFLASVQIGVTFATMLSSALGAATVSERVATNLEQAGVPGGWANGLALVGVTLIISFFSLVLGELVPKRLGLQRSESVALIASGPLTAMARIFRPVVWLLGVCTNALVRLLRGDPSQGGAVITQEELRSLVAGHGDLSTVERQMIDDVFDAEQTLVREVMVPRPEVEFLPASLSISRAARTAVAHPHSRFPVIGADPDDVVGVVHLRDLLVVSHPLGRAACVGDVSTPVTVIPGTKNVLEALYEMRRSGQHLAVVVDEYGGTDGIVTLEDLIEEIAGEMLATGADGVTGAEPEAAAAHEVDGRINLDDFAEVTGLELPAGPYDTVAGFLMARLGRLPAEGDAVEVERRMLTVREMDGRRVAKIGVSAALVARPDPGRPPDSAPAAGRTPESAPAAGEDTPPIRTETRRVLPSGGGIPAGRTETPTASDKHR